MQLRVGFTPEPQITPRVSNTKQSHEDLRKLARRATEMSSHAKPSVGSRSARLARPDAGYRSKTPGGTGSREPGQITVTLAPLRNEAHSNKAPAQVASGEEASRPKEIFGNERTLPHGEQDRQCKLSDWQHCPAVRYHEVRGHPPADPDAAPI
jgi:hypothetical protein